MAQIINGIRSVLSSPVIYDVFQGIMGAERVRQELCDEFIRPEAKGCRILDVGCGTAQILKYLPNSVEYWGYDISPEYIAAAKKNYGTRGHFYCCQPNELQALLAKLPKFDRVLAIGVLHHLDDEEVKGFFALAKEMLCVNGWLVTIDPCWVEGQSSIAKYLISKDRGCNVRDGQGYASLARDFFINIKGVIRHRKWIPYTHWIMECHK